MNKQDSPMGDLLLDPSSIYAVRAFVCLEAPNRT